MPRKTRTHFRHAFYHVMLRGNYQQAIFTDDQDRRKLFDYLAKAVETHGCKIHLFCFMDNHIHMVMEVFDIPLSKIMQCVLSSYVRHFNDRINKIGRLFQDRYKAKMISDDAYFLELCYYIHNNPLKAKMCVSLNDYPWSSHPVYTGMNALPWLTTTHIELLLKEYVNAESNHYRVFMEDRKNTYSKPAFCRFDELGNLTISNSIKSMAKSSSFLAIENLPIKAIAEVVCEHLQAPLKEVESGSQRAIIVLARAAIAYFAHYHGRHFLKNIAALFDMNADSLSRSINRFLQKASKDRYLQDLIMALERKLSAYDPTRLEL